MDLTGMLAKIDFKREVHDVNGLDGKMGLVTGVVRTIAAHESARLKLGRLVNIYSVIVDGRAYEINEYYLESLDECG